MATKRLTIDIPDKLSIAGILVEPERACACYVVAHGAGAGMEHPFMAAVSQGLYERGVATLRYQFPYMERGSKRPDPAPIAHAAVRAAVGLAARLMPRVPLIAGGKSFGARMTSQAQAEVPLPGVRGLALLGFPLHPVKKPSDERARHLAEVGIPMLFSFKEHATRSPTWIFSCRLSSGLVRMGRSTCFRTSTTRSTFLSDQAEPTLRCLPRRWMPWWIG
jgi:predicted alpha/beta-hydrolase family hydrolase